MLQESTQYGLKNHLKASKIEALSQGLYRVDLENKKNLQVSFLFIALIAPKILRIFYSDKNHFDYHEPNPFIERLEQDGFFDESKDDSDAFWLLSKEFKIQIVKHKLAINIFDSNHTLISADETELGYYKDHSSSVLCYKRYENLEQPPLIYGLGDKTGSINRWGKRLRNAPIDALGYDSSNTDPLYKDIPFFIHLDPKSQKAHGIFFDNFYKKFFDFGKERKPSPYYYFGAEAGSLNYYIFQGPDIKSILANYLKLTGMPCLLPDSAYGYLGSGMSYTENGTKDSGEKTLLEFFDRSIKKDIALTAFHLSSGYIQNQNNKRYQFIWNHEKFEEPRKFVSASKSMAISITANVKPVLLCDHPWYQEAKEFFIKKTNGEVLVVDYWGGSGSYIDFTDSRAQIWWKDKLKRYLLDFGIEGIWNDNNEYEIFEEHQRSGQELEMILIMSKLAYEASLESGLELPWILSRSGYSGIQKYASSWTGDNYSSWKSQQFDNAILSSCGLSGLVHMGVDIGGFFGPNPDPELFLRWIQNGVFHPRFCIHSYKSIPTEADMYQNTHKEFFEIIQKFMRLRQELIPYIKESAHKANQQGIPIMRPTVYDFQTETETYEQSFEYMFGDKFFVAPIYRSLSEEKEKTFYLPGKNHKWKHYFTGEEFIGGRYHTVKVDFSCIPVFELI